MGVSTWGVNLKSQTWRPWTARSSLEFTTRISPCFYPILHPAHKSAPKVRPSESSATPDDSSSEGAGRTLLGRSDTSACHGRHRASPAHPRLAARTAGSQMAIKWACRERIRDVQRITSRASQAEHHKQTIANPWVHSPTIRAHLQGLVSPCGWRQPTDRPRRQAHTRPEPF